MNPKNEPRADGKAHEVTPPGQRDPPAEGLDLPTGPPEEDQDSPPAEGSLTRRPPPTEPLEGIGLEEPSTGLGGTLLKQEDVPPTTWIKTEAGVNPPHPNRDFLATDDIKQEAPDDDLRLDFKVRGDLQDDPPTLQPKPIVKKDSARDKGFELTPEALENLRNRISQLEGELEARSLPRSRGDRGDDTEGEEGGRVNEARSLRRRSVRRRRQHSRPREGMGYASSGESTAIDATDRSDTDEDEAGIYTALRPAYAASLAVLKGDTNPQKVDRIVRDLEKQKRRTTIRQFRNESTRYNYEAQFIDRIPRFDLSFWTRRKAPSKNTELLLKQMRRYNKPFASAGPNLGDFLKEFVTQVDAFLLSKKQAEKVFVTFFESPFRLDIENSLKNNTLEATIEKLFVHKCNRRSRLDEESAIRNFRFDQKDILSDVFDYEGHLTRLNPDISREALDDAVRSKILQQMSDEDAHKIGALNEEHLMEKGCVIPFPKWIHHLKTLDVKLVKTPESPSKQVRAIAQDFPSATEPHPTNDPRLLHPAAMPENLTYIEGLREGRRIMHDCMSYFQSAEKGNSQSNGNSRKNRQGGARSDDKPRARPILKTDPEYQTCVQKFSKADLSPPGVSFPDDGKMRLPYDWNSHGKFVPEEKIMRVPSENTFFKDRTGTPVINTFLLAHFKNKCASCGMKGHAASHPACPLAKSGSTWDLCTICKAGYHTECLVDLKHVTDFVAPSRSR